MKRLYIALGLSLIFHISQYIGIRSMHGQNQFGTKTQTTIEVVETATPDLANKTITEKKIISLPKSVPVANDDPARFFSEQDQRVEKQTAVRNFGINNNQSLKSNKKNSDSKSPDSKNTEPEFIQALRQSTGSTAPSAIQQTLPKDIADGTATNLNTDAHIYASFYNRIADLFYLRWTTRINDLWDHLPLETKKNLSGQVWRTEIEIWLKSTGEYDRSFIMKPSGYPNFDNAAVFAFKNAQFFPNPPKAKVEPDGFIRLRYRIAIHVR